MDLYNPKSGDTTAPITDSIDGRWLSFHLRRLSLGQRALLAYNDLERGNVRNLTRAQAAALAQVSAGYVNTISRTPPEERELLERGIIKLSELHNKRRRRPVVTDADVERVVVEIGPERVMRALDRVTAPELPLVAAE